MLLASFAEQRRGGRCRAAVAQLFFNVHLFIECLFDRFMYVLGVVANVGDRLRSLSFLLSSGTRNWLPRYQSISKNEQAATIGLDLDGSWRLLRAL